MTGHDVALTLAATAIDFDLSADERTELEAHLDACPTCARTVHGLRADAVAIGALPAVPLGPDRADELLTRVLAPPARTGLGPLRLVLVAALLALLALGSLVVGAELLRRSIEDDLSVVPPVPSATVASDASRPIDNGIGTTWIRVDLPDANVPEPGGATMDGVIPGGPGAIAWGWAYGLEPRIWTTADGHVWERATVEVPTEPDPDILEPGTINDVIAGGPGYVAVGFYTRDGTGRRGLVWTSPDGRSWDLVPHEPDLENAVIYRVVEWRGELLAFGHWSIGPSGGATDAIAWASDDGRTWTRLDLALPDRLTLGTVVAAGEHLWATPDEIGDDLGMEWTDTLLVSDDGRTWQPSALPSHTGSLTEASGALISLVRPLSADSPVPAEARIPGVYRSTGGATWQLMSSERTVVGYDLVDVGAVLIMVGDDAAGDPECSADCQAMGWRSVDGGVTWQSVPADVVGGTMTSVAALPDGSLVAVGRLVDDQGNPSPAAWVSPLARQPATSAEPAGASAVARVVCRADGTTTVSTPIVRPQADGVHVSTTNEAGDARSLDVEGVGGDTVGPGTTETVWAVEPGVVRVACHDPGAGPVPDDAWAELTVVDPGGTFVSTALDCTDAAVGGGSSPPGGTGWIGDPVALTRASLAGSHPASVVEAVGYLLNDIRQVRVVDGGRAIARLAWVKADDDLWLLDTVTTCSGIDLGLDFGALDAMIGGPSPSR